MFVSVILPIRNEAPSIGEVLAAMLAQDYPHDLMETIVVDGMSEGGAREIVHELVAKDPLRSRVRGSKCVLNAFRPRSCFSLMFQLSAFNISAFSP